MTPSCATCEVPALRATRLGDQPGCIGCAAGFRPLRFLALGSPARPTAIRSCRAHPLVQEAPEHGPSGRDSRHLTP